MLIIQAKRSAKGKTIVIIDPTGEMHPCLEAGELWETVDSIVAAGSEPQVGPMGGAVMIQVKKSKKGALVLMDPDAEVHPCTDPEEMWDTLNELLDADWPEPVVEIATREEVRHHGTQDDGRRVYNARVVQQGDEVIEAVITEMVGPAAVDIGLSLIDKLRGASHRGPPAKPRRKKKKKAVKK